MIRPIERIDVHPNDWDRFCKMFREVARIQSMILLEVGTPCMKSTLAREGEVLVIYKSGPAERMALPKDEACK